MATLKLTSRGQVTFRKQVLKHLGVEPGDCVELDLQPGGQATLSAAKPRGSIENFLGILEGKTNKRATIEEMNEAIAKGWAGER